MQRHPAESLKERDDVYEKQIQVNKVIIELARKYQVKLIVANDVHFTNEGDADAHDILICLNTGKNFEDANRMRYTKQEWFKSVEEMNELFADVPEALENTQEIANKVEVYELNSAPIMPEFPIPAEFYNWDEFKTKHSEEDLKKEFERYNLNGDYHKMLRVELESEYLEYLVDIVRKNGIKIFGRNSGKD